MYNHKFSKVDDLRKGMSTCQSLVELKGVLRPSWSLIDGLLDFT